MVVYKGPEIALTLVMGAPLVGKSTWCREQQTILPAIFIIPYDHMLYSLRGTYNVVSSLHTVIANTVYDQALLLSNMSKNIHVVVDGFSESINDMERFALLTNKFSIIRCRAPHLVSLRRNAYNRKRNLPYRTNLPEELYKNTKFFDSKDFNGFIDHYGVSYTSLNPNVKQSVLEPIESSVI